MANNITYTIHDDFDFILEEKGNVFVALRKLTWGDKTTEPKFDIRKWYSSAEGETAGKGVSMSKDGLDELTSVLLSQGFGKTDEILESIKDREDFERSYDKVIKGVVFDDEDDTFYDPKEVLFCSEDEADE